MLHPESYSSETRQWQEADRLIVDLTKDYKYYRLSSKIANVSGGEASNGLRTLKQTDRG